MVKRVTDKQLQFIDFIMELDRVKHIKLNSMTYTQFAIIKEVGEYEESDVEMLDILTKQIFEQPNVRAMWKVWNN